MTSPPYWGLRDYGEKEQFGLEKTPEEYIEKMVAGFSEIKRVLRKDGTVFLNLGDSYMSGGGAGRHHGYTDPKYKDGRKVEHFEPQAYPHDILKPKDLCMMPHRVAIALQTDGWWVRSDIVWHKPNPMPESVTDRPTKSHEYIFLLTKSGKYFYDADAVREPYTEPMNRWGGEKTKATDKSKGDEFAVKERTDRNHRPNEKGRNLRDVWTINTASCSEAHFATFPESLVNNCILAGSAKTACGICGSPYEREVEILSKPNRENQPKRDNRIGVIPGRNSLTRMNSKDMESIEKKTIGYKPTCLHKDDTGKSIILDPFSGTNTVGYRAQELGRKWVSIELNPEYIKMGYKKTSQRVLI